MLFRLFIIHFLKNDSHIYKKQIKESQTVINPVSRLLKDYTVWQNSYSKLHLPAEPNLTRKTLFRFSISKKNIFIVFLYEISDSMALCRVFSKSFHRFGSGEKTANLICVGTILLSTKFFSLTLVANEWFITMKLL